MKAVKTKVLKIVAKAGKQSAIDAAGSASWFGYHQPKEPASLKRIKK